MGTSTAATAEDGTTKAKAKTATKAKTTKTKVVRKKKPATKSSASSNQAMYSAARTAQMELAGQRTAAAARLSDPLWFRVEDILPVTLEETAMAVPATKVLPEQVKIVEAALLNNNMTRADVTPQAFCILLEQARRHALELIADGQDYAISAGRSEITKADFDLAAQMRPDNPIAVTTQLPKLNLLSQQINRVPLPPIPIQCYSGILLPPKRHQLTARTFDVVSGAQVAQRMVQSKPSITSKPKQTSPSKIKQLPSYGATKGRQIPINLKEPEKTSAPAPAPSTSSGDGAPATTPTKADESSAATPMDISSPAPAPETSTPAPAPQEAADEKPTPMEISSPAPASTPEATTTEATPTVTGPSPAPAASVPSPAPATTEGSSSAAAPSPAVAATTAASTVDKAEPPPVTEPAATPATTDAATPATTSTPVAEASTNPTSEPTPTTEAPSNPMSEEGKS